MAHVHTSNITGGVHMSFENDITEIKKLFETPLDPDSQEVANISKQHGFGSVNWQEAMIVRIKRKLKNKEPLTGLDTTFIETQAMHNKQLMDELQDFGLKYQNPN